MEFPMEPLVSSGKAQRDMKVSRGYGSCELVHKGVPYGA